MTRPIRILQLTAIGDAMGSGYEYAPQDAVRYFHTYWGYRDHPLYPETVCAGQWTDDTMLSVAVARGIVADHRDGDVPRYHTLADEMVALHTAHPTKGYSKGMFAALDGARDGRHLITRLNQHQKTQSNGSAMRAACYGILNLTLEDLREATFDCSSLTHSQNGQFAAEVVASVVHYFFREVGVKADLNKFIAEAINPLYTLRYVDRVTKQNGQLAFITVCAALTAIRESQTLTEVLEKSIRCGGDVDTVAAIAMAIASVCPEIRDDLPQFVYDDIRPVAGLTWQDLVELDEQLTTLV